MNKLMKPTTKVIVRRSCRTAKVQSLGVYYSKVTVREKIRNPTTGRMVYRDGKVGIALTGRPQSIELDYFEQMKQRLMRTKAPRRSNRLKEKKEIQQRIEDGMNTTVLLLTKTIKMI